MYCTSSSIQTPGWRGSGGGACHVFEACFWALWSRAPGPPNLAPARFGHWAGCVARYAWRPLARQSTLLGPPRAIHRISERYSTPLCQNQGCQTSGPTAGAVRTGECRGQRPASPELQSRQVHTDGGRGPPQQRVGPLTICRASRAAGGQVKLPCRACKLGGTRGEGATAASGATGAAPCTWV